MLKMFKLCYVLAALVSANVAWAKFESGTIFEAPNGTRLEIVRFLGQGGINEVYECRSLDTKKSYALKLIKAEHRSSAEDILDSLEVIEALQKRQAYTPPWKRLLV